MNAQENKSGVVEIPRGGALELDSILSVAEERGDIDLCYHVLTDRLSVL